MPELIAASSALGLLVEASCPKRGDHPERDETTDTWAFPGTVRDTRDELRGWIGRMLPDSAMASSAMELAIEAWTVLCGRPPIEPKRRSTRARPDRDSVDPDDLTRCAPWIDLTGELWTRIEGGEAISVASVSRHVRDRAPADEFRSLYAVLAGLVVAGSRLDGMPAEGFVSWTSLDAVHAAIAAVLADPGSDAGSMVVRDDASDPLDVFHDPATLVTEEVTSSSLLTSVWITNATDDDHRAPDETTALTGLVPATIAVVLSHARGGDWWQRTAFRLERFYDVVHARLDGTEIEDIPVHHTQVDYARTADLLDRPRVPENLTGLAAFAARDNRGTRSADTIAALATRVLAQADHSVATGG
ncbi:hypothetical protein [Stackebrandtia soli]|uniref:hypothetical protein n=1 Tax=Stackebrandtia soli TaxID=1892856 RepID=UPI0039EBF0D3